MDIKIVKHNLPELYTDKAYYLEKTIGKPYSESYSFTYTPDKETIEDLFKEYKESNFLFTAESSTGPVGFIIGRHTERIGNYTKILSINEISMSPAFRGLRISEKLRESSIVDYQPNIIYGEANNPVSVKSREIACSKLGYYSYWMEEPISKSNPLSKEQIHNLSYELAEYFDSDVIDRYVDGCKPFMLYSDVIPNEKFNTVPEYEALFRKIKGYSDKVCKTCLGVLISVKSGYKI